MPIAAARCGPLVFLDADSDGYSDYLIKLRPLLQPGGLIAAHNVASASR